MVDGELVYKVNKTTIKKINVTVGPRFSASSILSNNPEISDNNTEPTDNSSPHTETEATELTGDSTMDDTIVGGNIDNDNDGVESEVREEPEGRVVEEMECEQNEPTSPENEDHSAMVCTC